MDDSPVFYLFTVFLLLFLPQLCRCGKPNEDNDAPPQKCHPDNILDISIQGWKTDECSGASGGDLCESLSPKGVFFTEVTDGHLSIWRAEGDEKCVAVISQYENGSRILILHIWNYEEKKHEVRRYENDDEGWMFIEHTQEVKGHLGSLDELSTDYIQGDKPEPIETIYTRQSTTASEMDFPLRDAESTDLETSFTNFRESFEEVPLENPLINFPPPPTLNIAHPDASICTAIDVNITGIQSRVYIMKVNANIYRVSYDNDDIWEAEYAEKCTFCIYFIHDRRHKLLMLRTTEGFSTKNIFYKHNGTGCCTGGWHKTSRQCPKDVDKLRKEHGTPFSIDISNDTENLQKYQISTHRYGSITARYYATVNGYIIDEVVDNSNSIWTAREGKFCFMVELYIKEDTRLLRLYTKSSDTFSCSCFEKKGIVWEKIDYIVFDKLLSRIQG
ncbi:signal peptide containing protein [Theileria equi strain WA]|uniref:Signal peptide containing protein n=1 Tax=Theileria equi strain WA TaxID=1537102 RepID=L1LET8_THEEQ|nr:signal peptide containing protein [Theileria equi strain WA]EKX73693.1 signal peptide containing protein [Theileria equi strain WA]|eukprot:XP_004833145.1 signal peptide containing protein [Theileria equi strain WA]